MKKRILIAALAACVLLSFAGCSNGKTPSGTDTSSSASTESTPTTSLPDRSTAEPNTSEMVDAIAREARAEAESGIDTNRRDEAVDFIVQNYPDYFSSNEVMEQTMYYGYLLEYAYQDSDRDYASIGQDAEQVVKYVYRGAETVEDDATQENLRQIQEDLSEIGIDVG